MSVSRRCQKATARALQPVTTFLRNQRFAANAQRQQDQSSTTGKRKRPLQNIEMSSHGSGPDYRLKLYEEAIQAEYLAKGLKPLPKGALKRAAERRRDDKVLHDMQAIGKRVRERAGQALFEAAMQNEDPMMPDTYFPPEEEEDGWYTEHAWSGSTLSAFIPARDTLELLKKVYPDSFTDEDSEYSRSQRLSWNKVKGEEDDLAAAFLDFQAKDQSIVSERWPAGDHTLTLLAPGPKLRHVKLSFSRVCDEHGVIDEHANRLELVSRGYIPVSMGRQNVAIAADLLAFYMKVLVYGPLSRQGWVRAICDHMQVEYTDHARVLFSDALELYTRLVDVNDQKLDLAIRLGGESQAPLRDATPTDGDLVRPADRPGSVDQNGAASDIIRDTYARGVKVEAERCPSCFYRLADESASDIGAMFTVDGNFSWKRLGRHNEVNYRVYDDSDFRIPPQEVDRHQPRTSLGRTATSTEESQGHVMKRCSETQREITQTVMKHNDETGIVTLACRHGVMWRYVDMIQSGEGIKYASSLLHWLILTGAGDKSVVGYDTGCTLRASGNKQDWVWRILRDAKGCFRIRTSLQEWRGVLVRSNVKNALKLLNTGRSMLNALRQRYSEHGVSLDDGDLELYRQQEIEFLRKTDSAERQAERKRIEARISYVKEKEVLIQLGGKLNDMYDMLEARTRTESGRMPAMTPAQTRILGDAQLKVTEQTKKVVVLATVASIDDDDEWTPGADCWKAILQEEKKLKHHAALRDVEVECIQRLFEMEKMGFAGTAYRHRKKIITAVKNRNKRLKDLIIKCNEAGQAAGHLQELEWQHVVEDKMEIGLFAVLKQMREGDLLIHKWAQPVSREALRLWFQIKRAEEELRLLAVEWRGLRKGTTLQPPGHDDREGVAAGLERRLQQMQRDHQKILFSLARCADVLIDSDCGGFTMSNPLRSTDLRHLPEMNRYNLRTKHHIGQDFSIPSASKQSSRTFGHGSENLALEIVPTTEEPLLEERNEALIDFLAWMPCDLRKWLRMSVMGVSIGRGGEKLIRTSGTFNDSIYTPHEDGSRPHEL
ncbi:hypothetical protein QFC21_007342 [Naganishia friedmannii]|uniref:Uncharacterized protein n=1 Tax=Naganishia friedmannii TaxID=89922 RepID=A0ACC2UW88_9TREE|nr:hypothetical protein QFC21_007342 [Naganishia friedmannii]